MISVIMPIFNQYCELDIVLRYFAKQTIKAEFEIILVDDFSTDCRKEILGKYQDLNIKYLRNDKNRGRAFSRNVAIENSTGEYLIFCDCDRIPTENFIEDHMNVIDSNKAVISIGKVTETYEHVQKLTMQATPIPRRKAIYYNTISKIYNVSGKTDSCLCWLSTLSGNMAIKKSTLSDCRFSNEFKEWGFEHFELGYQLWKRRVQYILNAKAENIHIAHSRNKNFYHENIVKSHSIFYEKHRTKEIFYLKEFMLGEISLQEYEIKIDGPKKWMKMENNPIILKQINF